ncbi:MAG: anion permease [Verrucomicrobia bacterium]|nr:anion permease [Verrucomicrobiota bacterium]MBS0645155.1 anion permease [Verrucomicrobiota bacterium]
MKRKQFLSLCLVFAIGLGIWFYPAPQDVPIKGWHLLAIFLATIVGVILKPLPMGALSILALSAATLTHTLSLQEALNGFHNEIAWLVLLAFFISKGFIQTGLGRRIAYYFVSIFGKRTLGLSYGLLLSELILAPAIPSVTARTGGIIYPVAKGIAQSFGSDPAKGTARLIGSFLMKSAYQGSIITSAMFLTAMAANPLIAGLTQDAGFQISWGTWALAAAVPGCISLLVMPYFLYKFYPPDIHFTPNAAKEARSQLIAMGRLSFKECVMLSIFVLLVVLWIFGSSISIKATTAAFLGLACILLFGVLSWEDVIAEKSAWDTFIWFSALIMLAGALSQNGFTPWLSQQVVKYVGHMPWALAFSILVAIYFYSHYLFASSTAHVSAMYPAFLMVAIALGAPPMLSVLVLAFSSNLFGGLTHYGSGPAPLYFGSGYIDIQDWWRLGFFLSVINIIIWFGLGLGWWKILGLW